MTHGCLLIIGEDYPKGILLHTSHTGIDIVKWVKKIPSFLASQYDWITSEKKAKDQLRCDGSLCEWLSYPLCVAGMAIAVSPRCLLPVYNRKDLPRWSGADRPVKLRIKDGEWHITDGERSEVLDPFKAFTDCFKKEKA